MFKQSENAAIAHLIRARAAACSEGCGLCNNRYRFKVHATSICTAHGTNGQAGYRSCIDYVSMVCERVLLIDDHAY